MVLGGASVRKSSVILLVAFLILSLFYSLAFGGQKVEAASNSKIIGYYPSWGAYGRNYNVMDMDVSKVTHINYAFADICWNGIHGNSDPTGPNPVTWACQDEAGTINVPNGTIVLGDPWIDTGKAFPGDTWDKPIKGNLGQLIKQKQANPHLKTIISVGGWSWSNRFSDVAASAATRETFANSAVDFLRKYQFDGVDLDWEYPVSGGLAGNSVRAADKQNYTLLLQKIREKLNAAGAADGKTYLLTIASGASPTYAQNTELGNIAAIVDWINIMTYDFNGGWQTVSAHNAPLNYDPAAAAAGVPNAATYNSASGVQGHLDAGVPASKIVLGVPFYGRGWANCAATGNGQYQSCSGVPAGTWEAGLFDYTDLENNYINKNGYTRYWNDTAKVPYLYNAVKRTFISYDDTESLGHKTAFIQNKGLGGAMFWEFSGDRNKVLLNKLASDLAGSGSADIIAPSVPGNLQSTAKTSNSVTLAWGASTDNVGVTGYTVTYGSTSVNVTGTSTTISGLAANTAYTFTVKAKDAAGNISGASNALSVTTNPPAGDTTPPTAPTNLQVTGKTSSSVSLSWTASTDNVGVTGYTVTYGSTSVNVTGTSTTISGLAANTAYTFTVTAKDAAGNISGASNALPVTTNPAAGDTTSPTAPTNLQVTGKTSSSVSLSWTASTDNVGVTGYTVTYGSTNVNVTGTSTTISGLAANTAYAFTVVAKDAAGNVSSGTSVAATTDANGGTVSAWAPNVSYKANDLVTYGGKTYYCIQPHTSLAGWEPSNVPALWGLK
ncbi:chitinase [Paenibacillus sp. FSL A5-0031]|uniref:glycosyl hydrolase family 18 protein n=1 Tax=Paenibacillus sp. FSL A5-0031 TaxID=1920420 RepID=UPI00096E280F|nr:glycosyl hydrolase family 18 protein [Paenibacillus sp. FSL A5-0031]OME79516.1 chitinase [Paenibacillus sp. FSL A5-0031]